MQQSASVDILIIGAGPAGLAAAAGCADAGRSFAVVEMGTVLQSRDRNDGARLTHGVGGAGLYSDGKFSFFPSATKLWVLKDQIALRRAYAWLEHRLMQHSVEPPKFPKAEQIAHSPDAALTGLKQYQSVYMPLEMRLRLIEELSTAIAADLHVQSTALGCRFDSGQWTSTLSVERSESLLMTSRAVIFAGGRYGPLFFQEAFPQAPTIFRHVEVGIRLEQPNESFFLARERQLDPKIRIAGEDPGTDLRTFCCCRGGEVITARTCGLWSISGRADGLDTGRSNVGLNLRITDPTTASDVLQQLLPRLREQTKTQVPEALTDFLSMTTSGKGASRVVELLGARTARSIAAAVARLQKSYPSLLDPDTRLWAPALEGVGTYPLVDGDLRVGNLPLWIAGDSSGTFRGLTAAMVSGFYAGLRASRLGER